MRYILFVILLSVNISLIGQSVFSKRMHLGFPSIVLSGVESNDSCFYVTGLVADSIAPFNSGLLFMKYNWAGEQLLIKTMLDTSKTYEAWSNTLTPLNDGNFILSAFSSYNEGLILKLTPQGDTIFTSGFRSPYYPATPFINVRDLVIMDDGSYVTVSIINNDLDSNILLTKMNSSGIILWQKTYGGSTTEIVHSLLATNDGGFLIGAGKSNVGLYLVKTDGDGEEEWVYTYPVALEHGAAFELYELPVGGDIIIATNELVTNNQGTNFPNPVLMRLDENQGEVWKTRFRDEKQAPLTKLTKILPLDDQYFLAGGSGYQELSDGPQTVGKLVKASYEGDSIWTRYYHHIERADANNLLYDLEATPDGGFIMCGQARGTENPTPTNPNQQGWLLKVDEHGCLVPGCHIVSSTIDLQSSSFDLKTYPNPIRASSGDYINAYFYHPKLAGETAYFSLVDASGKELLEFESQHGDITHMVPVSGLASGVYWLRCQVGAEVLTKEIVLQ